MSLKSTFFIIAFLILFTANSALPASSQSIFSDQPDRQNEATIDTPFDLLSQIFLPLPKNSGIFSGLLRFLKPASVSSNIETKPLEPITLLLDKPTTIEAVRFAKKTGLAENLNGLWAMWSEGEISHQIYFPKTGIYSFKIKAKADYADNSWPILRISIDNEASRDALIDTNYIQSFTRELTVSSGWHNLKFAFLNDFYIPLNADRNLYLDLIKISLSSCSDNIKNQNETAVDCGGQCLPCQNANSPKKIIFGTAVESIYFTKNPTVKSLNYQSKLKELFSWATIETAGHIWTMHFESRDKYFWDAIDATFDWFNKNNLNLKYHAIVWDKEDKLPQWYQDLLAEEKQKALEEHVKTIVKKYKGGISMYDLVNEPIHYGDDNNYMGTGWQKSEAIANIFNWAESENPDAIFLINEYDVLTDNQIRNKYIELINQIKERGAVIDAVGLQAHFNFNDHKIPAKTLLKNALDEIALETKLPVYITEFDLIAPDNPDEQFENYNNWWDYQAAGYKETYELFREHISVNGVFIWGFYDGQIWAKGAGLFDENFNPKPNYYSLKNILIGK